MGMKCPACGSMVVYDIKQGLMQCVSCSSTFSVHQYDVNNDAEAMQTTMSMNMDIYHCKNCGAELDAPEEQTVAYCMYCGGETLLTQKSQPVERPQKIIPFKHDVADVREAFQKAIKGRIFVPAEFEKPEFIEGFRGIYMPYWDTKVELESQRLAVEGIKTTTSGDYTITSYYDMQIDVYGKMHSGCYDASEAFDDTIAAEIAPFHVEECVPFREGYLAGFYSDKVTADFDNYQELISWQTITGVKKQISEATDKIEVKEEKLEKMVQSKLSDRETLLFPVWFLTWRKGKRVAYSVMNGETGKMTMDIPVDAGKLFRSVLIGTVIIFAILSLIPAFILPTQMAIVSSIFLCVSSLVFGAELSVIKKREQHVFDFGNSKYKTEKQIPGKKKKAGCLGSALSAIGWIIGIFGMGIFFGVMDGPTPDDVRISFGIVLVIQIIIAIKQLISVYGIGNKMAILPIIITVLMQLLGVIIADESRQHDYWYYGISMITMFGMIMNMLVCVFYMNYLTTRPVPNFFTRKGADQNA